MSERGIDTGLVDSTTSDKVRSLRFRILTATSSRWSSSVTRSKWWVQESCHQH
jgi:hypothetical protein